MFFMRHGQSTFNVICDETGRDPHTPDAPLSPFGMKQVEAAAARFTKRKIGLILTSPYTRALQTASLMAKVLNAPIVVEPLVGERRLYSCDIGTPASALKTAWPGVDFSRLPGEGAWWLPFDETRADLMKRVRAFDDEWGWREEAAQTLVVSHWYFIESVTSAGLDNAEIIER